VTEPRSNPVQNSAGMYVYKATVRFKVTISKIEHLTVELDNTNSVL